MILQAINSANTNFPPNLLTTEEGATEKHESNWVPLSCCDYSEYQIYIDTEWETDIDA